ncbi:MAG: hypothetical protein J6B50_07955 [Lachnospiraceae bacterium]|nr:hypothetical protein [Lachnospiraceae bacterium]
MNTEVLKAIYDAACSNNIINNYKFNENIVQSMNYTDIKNKVQMDEQILLVCLMDLESIGFIINTMRNPYKECEYAISFLGIEYFKQLN